MILNDKSKHDRIVDFTSPEFAEFRGDAANFSVSVHLTRTGAKVIVADINRQLDEWIRSFGTIAQ